MPLSVQEAFSSIEDPRVERDKRHMLIDIIILFICAVINGAEGWEAIEQFGKNKGSQWIPRSYTSIFGTIELDAYNPRIK